MIIEPFCRKPNFYETDKMGIIHHSNYIRWFEEARVDLLEKINFPYKKVTVCGIDFAVLDVFCEYKAMIHYEDTVNIYVSVPEIKEMKMAMNYKIVNEKTGEVCTLGRTGLCFYDNNRKRPVSLKKTIPELYDLFCLLNKSASNG